MDVVKRVLGAASTAAAVAAGQISAIASSLNPTPEPPRPSSPPPYTGPDLLTSLSHDLHALIFTFLPLRMLFSTSRVSRAFLALPSHPVADELFRRQLFAPADPESCTDKQPSETWRAYVTRIVDVEHRLISSDTRGVKYEIGGCDERVRGPRMYVSMLEARVMNHDERNPIYWQYIDSPNSAFQSLLVLRNVCWLAVETYCTLPCPPSGHSPYRFRVFFRLGVSESSNLGSPTFSVVPVADDAVLCSETKRVVHNDELRRLINERESVVMGVGQDEHQAAAAAAEPGHVWDGEQDLPRPRAGFRVPAGQAEALMGQMAFVRFGGRGVRRRRSIGSAPIRSEIVMRELLVGDVLVRPRDDAPVTAAPDGEEKEQGEQRDSKDEKREPSAAQGARRGPGTVKVDVKCVRIGPNEGWKQGVAFDCIVIERLA